MFISVVSDTIYMFDEIGLSRNTKKQKKMEKNKNPGN